MQRIDSPGWILDELAHAGPEHLDPGYVARYDEKAGVDPEEDLAILRDLGLNETSTLIDVGAGAGALALAAAPFCRRVVAVDVSAAMLAALRQKAERLGIRNIEGVQAGFLSYEHMGAPADVVYSRHALHHLPDVWKAIALARIAAMLKPGGAFRLRDLIYTFDPAETEERFAAWVSRAPERPEQGWTRAELETHIREEHSTFSWLLEPMLQRAGFTIAEATSDPSGIFAAYTCVKG